MIKLDSLPISFLRVLSADKLRDLKEPIVIEANGTPIAAIIPYRIYLEHQKILDKVKS